MYCPTSRHKGARLTLGRANILTRLAAIDDGPTRAATDAERELLRLMGGSCELALGALARVDGGEVVLNACLDGRRVYARAGDPFAVARAAAMELGAIGVA